LELIRERYNPSPSPGLEQTHSREGSGATSFIDLEGLGGTNYNRISRSYSMPQKVLPATNIESSTSDGGQGLKEARGRMRQRTDTLEVPEPTASGSLRLGRSKSASM
jgi:hypothetical protein